MTSRYIVNFLKHKSKMADDCRVFQKCPLQNPVTWYGINYAGTLVTQWDFQNKGTRASPAQLSFRLKVLPRSFRPSIVYSVPCDRSLQRAHSSGVVWTRPKLLQEKHGAVHHAPEQENK